ncbi:MAG TPA: hypothetical protein VGN37_06300 [Actinocatenispora sp.]
MNRLPFPLADQLPAALHGVLLDFWWDVEKLWALELPDTRLAVAELRWLLDLPMWAYGGAPFRVTPHQVAADPLRYAGQYARTMAADPRHPLHVTDRGGRLVVLDGMHRLLRAELAGRRDVAVRVVPGAALDAIAHHAETADSLSK